MPSLPQSTPPPPTPPPIDLTSSTESTRRALYDRVADFEFNPTREEIQDGFAQGGVVDMRTAEEAGLTLFFVYGRWFAVWSIPDAPEGGTEADQWDVLRVSEDPRSPCGLMFQEV
ncbi:MAG TPA: hypothetical protein VOA87_09735 [Thermoanaerobaculia bacterium]|nr:hypothetical protein [Thermoanaerobaculia bacterium]